jgi:hypothetical protein
MSSIPASLPDLAPLTVVAAALFTGGWLVLDRLSPGFTVFGTRVEPYDWIAQPISGLGLGKTAVAMNTVFVLTGVLMALGLVGVLAGVPALSGTERMSVGAVLLLSPLGTAMCGLFTLERIMPHAAGFLLAMGAPIVGFLALGWQLGREPRFETLGHLLVAAAPVTLALLTCWFRSFDPEASGQGRGVAGLLQRILATEVLGVLAVLGWSVRAGSTP